ncbi:MAG: methyltransferase family protein [Candidatus Heimdallarchaeota archaeon]
MFIGIDIVIRPLSTKKDQFNRSILIFSFLAFPVILLLPHLESKISPLESILSDLYNFHVSIGIGLLIIGGIILIISRIQLGELGGSKIVIEDNHRLMTDGMYKYVRHPIYLGFLLIFSGYSFAMGSIIMKILILIALFLIFRRRMEIEENLLATTFGDEFFEYKKKTARLVPFFY